MLNTLKKASLWLAGSSCCQKSSYIPLITFQQARDKELKGPPTALPKKKSNVKAVGEMALPYFRETREGRWMFAGLLGLALLNAGVSVLFSYLQKDLWNALSKKNTHDFSIVLAKYVYALILGVPSATLFKFQRERLTVHWREWMTSRMLSLYQENQVYFTLQQQIVKSNDQTSNPDQRIAEDVKSFTSFSLYLFLTLVTSTIDLISFSWILCSIYPKLFFSMFGYALVGTGLTTWLGRGLIQMNYDQLTKEANFRYALVRLRDNAESIAFFNAFGREKNDDTLHLESRAISRSLQQVVANTRALIGAERNLDFFINTYTYLIHVVPIALVAPQYFAGAIELGVISQAVGAFRHVLNDLSVVVNQFEQLSRFSAGVERLSTFLEAIQHADPSRKSDESLSLLQRHNEREESAIGKENIIDEWDDLSQVESVRNDHQEFGTIDLQCLSSAPLHDMNDHSSAEISSGLSEVVLDVQNLSVSTPDKKRLLVRDLSIQVREGERLLIVGNSGCGKSSLLRAIAGLWTSGNGHIKRHKDVFFLPQRPYCTIGTLKEQLLYPNLEQKDEKPCCTDEDLLKLLEKVDLGQLAASAGDGDPFRGLYATMDWSNTLSLGEQQRLSFGRVLVNQPRLLILDEATSSLSVEGEEKMHSLLRELAENRRRLGQASLTYVSVGHRPTLLAHHDLKLRLTGEDEDYRS